jgi:hypothetical protein
MEWVGVRFDEGSESFGSGLAQGGDGGSTLPGFRRDGGVSIAQQFRRPDSGRRDESGGEEIRREGRRENEHGKLLDYVPIRAGRIHNTQPLTMIYHTKR